MGALCCNHAPANPAECNSTSVHPSHGSHGRLPAQLEHSPTHPHRHQLNDRSESTQRCLAHVERMNWERAAGSGAGRALTLPPVPGAK